MNPLSHAWERVRVRVYPSPLPEGEAGSNPLSLRERVRVRVELSTHKKTGHKGRFCCVDHLTVYFALRRLAAAPTTAKPASIRA